MKKIFLVLLIVCSFACKSKMTDTNKVKLSDTSFTTGIVDTVTPLPVDTSANRVNYELQRIDSNLKYYTLAQKYDMLENKDEILYYQTGDEKYYKLFYKHDKLRVKYAKECDKYSKSKYLK